MNTSNGRGMLGTLWLIYGIVHLAVVIFLVFFAGTATVMFGALLARVPNPFALISDFHFLYLVCIVWGAAGGIFALLAAGALLMGHGAAPRVAIVAAFLALPDLPFGLMLGVYTLILFLRSDSRTL